VIATDTWVFVCFNAKEIEVAREMPRQLARLGPDLLAPAAGSDIDGELQSIVARARSREAALGEILLDQRVASGIGNVYKCESLFLEQLDPWRLAGTVDDATLARLFRRAQHLMSDNFAHGGWRVTTNRSAGRTLGRDRHWVYRRKGRPCYRCNTAIDSRLQGTQARMTYWCSECQR
jgi:endonuclease-8